MQTRRMLAVMVCAVAAAGVWAWGCSGGGQQSSTSGSETPPPASTPAASDTASMGGASGDLAAGEAIYKEKCVLCHGAEGRGDGVGAAALNPKPRNHHDQAYMNSRTDEQLLEVLKNGKGQMPKWEGVLTEQQMHQVLLYVRELGKTP